MSFFKRLLRFRIRTILILMVLCAFLFALCNWRLNWYREQGQLVSEIRKFAIHVEMQPGSPSWLQPFAQEDSFASIKAVSFQGRKKLKDDDLMVFAKTPHLRVLSLHGTNITDDGMKHLSNLEALDTLSLKFTSISDDGLAHLSGLNNLVKLQLSDSKISGLGLKHLAGMQKLQHLELRNLEIIDDDLKHLEPLQELRYLHVETRNLNGSGLASIGKLKKLKTLHFRCYEFDTVELRDLPDVEQITLIGGDLSKLHVVNCPKLTVLHCKREYGRQDRRPDIHLENLPLLSDLLFPAASAMTLKRLDSIAVLPIRSSDLERFTLAEMPQLGRIQIDNATLPKDAFLDFPLLPKLKRVHIVNTNQRNEDGVVVLLPGEAIAALGKQPALERLSFGQQSTVKDALPRLKGFPSLTHIRMDHCHVTDDAVAQLPIAKQLTAFMVIDGSVTGSSLKAFVGGKLETLCLQDCPLNEEGMQYFSQFPQLDQISLSQSSIKDIHLRHLTHLYKLKYLCLTHTEIGEEGMRHVVCLPNLTYASYDLFSTKVSEEYKLALPQR